MRVLRLSAVLVSLLLPALVLARWTIATAPSSAVEAHLTIPHQIGEWTAVDERPLEDDVLAQIEPADYLMRLYAAPGRAPVWVYVGLYSDQTPNGKSAHDPEVCYPAQGWEIMESQGVQMSVGEDGRMHAKQLEVQNGAMEELVLYWFQPADRWQGPYTFEQLARVLDAVRGRSQYAFVRLSAVRDRDVSVELSELAAALAPAVRRDVDAL